MVELIKDNPEVKAELLAEYYDFAAMFDDVTHEPGGAAGETETEEAASEAIYDDDVEEMVGGGRKKKTRGKKQKADWMTSLELNANGTIKCTLHNITSIIQNDPRLRGAVAKNVFTGETICRRNILSKSPMVPDIVVQDGVNGDLWTDRHDTTVRAILDGAAGPGKTGYGLKVTDRDITGAVLLAGLHNQFHPIRAYLESLIWDGIPRLNTVLHGYLGCPDTAYHRDVGRNVFVAGVTRVYEPGHKFDYAMILEGAQGGRKSTFISIMAKRRWFAELTGNLKDRKQMVEQMQNNWIMELPELAGIRKSEVDDTKAFLSANADQVRRSYGRRADKFPRQCIFIGSTNDRKYLKDTTGNRRFWPVKVSVALIDTDAFEANVDQLWAEALVVYLQMRADKPISQGWLPLHLVSPESHEEAVAAQQGAMVDDADEALAGEIEEWLDSPLNLSSLTEKAADQGQAVIRTRTCLKQIYREMMEGDTKHYDNRVAQRLGAAARRIAGWREAPAQHRIPNYGKQRCLDRIGATPLDLERGYMFLEEEDLVG